MGSGKWDTDVYVSSAASRRATGKADFGYDADVKTGKARGIHASVDPKAVAGPASPFAGKNIRESRDSADHPNSLPIMALFDVTGSMGQIPKVLQKKLGKLMDIVIEKAGVKDPQVLVGAIGDSTCDQFPFQAGQFESDNRFDEQLRSLILEGGGGGQYMESYGLAYRFAAHHTATDSFEKRGKKGYLFTMGDEAFWPTITKHELNSVFGVDAKADESVEELYARASEQWEIFHIFIEQGSYASNTEIPERWKALIGERFIRLADADLVCETIAGLVYMLESAKSVDTVVDDIGLKGSARTAVKNALVPVSSRTPAHVGKGNLPARSSGARGVTRL